MNSEREKERHLEVLEQIRRAENKEDLPNITISKITSYLMNNAYLGDERLQTTEVKGIVKTILDNGLFSESNVCDVFIRTLRSKYPEALESDYLKKYKELLVTGRIDNLLIEISARNQKIKDLKDIDDYNGHIRVLNEIENIFEEKELPKVGMGALNIKIQRSVINRYTINY